MDLQALLAISFAEASVKLWDSGANHGGNNSPIQEFMRTGEFAISFAGFKSRESTQGEKS